MYENKRKPEMKCVRMAGVLACIFIAILFPIHVQAEEQEAADQAQVLEEQLSTGEISSIQEQLDKYAKGDIQEILPAYDPQKILEDAAKGNMDVNLNGFLQRIGMYLCKEIYLNMNIMIKLIVLIILCAILKNLQASFMSESVGEIAFYACYIVIVSILLVSFHTVMDLACNIIDSMVAFMHATIPVLITLLATGGNLTSAGIFQPILVMLVEVTATVMKNLFIPLIFLSTVLTVIDNISDKVEVSRLTGFIKQISGWVLGLILTVFIAVISIQGSVGAVVDGVTSKTAKFAISTFVPVAGKYLADAADTVIGCTLLIKNAAGLAVMIGVIAICIVPLLKILALVFLFRITCVLVEPISEKRIVNCINQMAGSLTFILGIVASIAFMFLVSITVMIGAGNISTMIR